VGYVLSSFIQLCFSSYLVRKTTGLFLMAVWSSRRAHSTDDNAVMVTG
jgi:hypothetical protein